MLWVWCVMNNDLSLSLVPPPSLPTPSLTLSFLFSTHLVSCPLFTVLPSLSSSQHIVRILAEHKNHWWKTASFNNPNITNTFFLFWTHWGKAKSRNLVLEELFVFISCLEIATHPTFMVQWIDIQLQNIQCMYCTLTPPKKQKKLEMYPVENTPG